MLLGARIFVAIVFSLLAISFIATTATLYLEFQEGLWVDFAMFYSHLFVFFPTFGIIALITFYIPASIFVDMYWQHIPYGKIRFAFGAFLLAVLSYFIADKLVEGKVKDFWALSPTVLKADKGGTASDCDPSIQSCRYVSVLDGLSDVREKSQSRLGLSKFARECSPDPLVEKSPELLAKRYCFVSQTLMTAEECCKVQKGFSNSIVQKYEKVENRSQTEKLHIALLPLKVFFLLVIVVIGIMLAAWRRSIERFYPGYMFYIERGLLLGAAVMLFWPIANHAFLQSREVLLGAYAGGIYAILAPVFSIIFGAWALALLLFFFRGMEKNVEAVGKVAGVIGSAVAILKYDEIIDYSVRIAGSGADQVTVGILLFVGLTFIVPMFYKKKKLDRK